MDAIWLNNFLFKKYVNKLFADYKISKKRLYQAIAHPQSDTILSKSILKLGYNLI
jgi:hypothetical protein